MPKDLDQLGRQISVELRNPFSKIGSYSLSWLKDATNFCTRHSVSCLTNAIANDVDAAKTPLNATAKAVTTYSDYSNVEVFVPVILKPTAYMLDYANVLYSAARLSEDIMRYSTHEAKKIVNAYLGQPDKLSDIVPVSVGVLDQLENHNSTLIDKRFGELTIKNGSQSTRRFGKAYRRFKDYEQTNQVVREIDTHLSYLIRNINNFRDEIREIDKLCDQLLFLVQSKPDEYQMGNVAAHHLASSLQTLAKEAEYVAATIHNANIFRTAVMDTNVVIGRIK